MLYSGLVHLNKKIPVELNDDLKTSLVEIRFIPIENAYMLTFDGGNVYKFLDDFKSAVGILNKYNIIIYRGKIYLIDKSGDKIGWINIKNNKCLIQVVGL